VHAGRHWARWPRWLRWAVPSLMVLGGLAALVFWGVAKIPEESPYPGSCAYWIEEDYARLDRVPLAELVGDPVIVTSSATCSGDSVYPLTRDVEVSQPLSVPSIGEVIGEWQVVSGNDAGQVGADDASACLTSERAEWRDVRVVIRADHAWAEISYRGRPDPCYVEASRSTAQG